MRLVLVATISLASVIALAADPGAPSPPDVLTTRDLGPLETTGKISGRDGAYSTRIGGVSLWVYGDTALTTPGSDGGTWRHNTMSWTHDLDATDGVTGFSDWNDSIGAPVDFIPYTIDELAFNDRHRGDNCQEPPCNVSIGFWPGTIVADAAHGRVYYTYAKMWLGSTAWDFHSLGTGIAVGPAAGAYGNAERPSVRPESAEPTLLFDETEPGFVNASFVESVGGVPYAYLFACTGDGFSKPMRLARVPLANILDRSAWRFFAGSGAWSADVADAAIVFDGSDQLSVHFSPFLGRYLAVYVDPLTTNVVARVADRPEGPWSDEGHLFDALPPVSGGLVYCGMTHLEYERDGGRIEVVGYVRDTGSFLSERHLVEVEFARRVAADDRDAEYDPQHGVLLSDLQNKNQLCMGSDGVLWRQLALQFRLNVPERSTITRATALLVSSGRNAGSYTAILRAIAQDDVAPFVAGPGPSFTDGYPLTAASAAWTPPNLPSGSTAATPDLTALVQEVVARPGWRPGHALGLVFPETRTGQNLRCFEDFSAAATAAAALRVGYYANGTPVCADARAGEDALAITREPCAAPTAGPARQFVFGRVGALRVVGTKVDLGPLRCGGSSATTTATIVGIADPDQPAGDASFYLVRAAGGADFGRAQLADGSTPPRQPSQQSCP